MADIRGKRIIMTGATGFIGSYTARAFLSEGAEIYALVRPGSEYKAISDPHFHVVTGELGDIERLSGFPERADLFLHFAWGGVNRQEIDDDAVHRRNLEESLGCLRLCGRLSIGVFMDAGSRVEYGIKEDGIMEESMDCDPVNAYGREKLHFYEEAAELCRESGIEYYHLRYFSVYGQGDHAWSIISTLTRELPLGHKVKLSDCRHRWNFMEVRDAAEAVTELYRHSFPGRLPGGSVIVNIASKDTRVLRDFVEEIYELAGRRGELSFGTFQQAKEGPLSICPDLKRLSELTDGAFRERISFSEGIRELIKYNETIL